jgi:hypothetical protein
MTDGPYVTHIVRVVPRHPVGPVSYLGAYQGFPRQTHWQSFKASILNKYSMVKPTVYHHDTYREELGKAYSVFGYALWDPDPGQYPHARVGDVGFIRGGKFHRLFNTLLPEDDPSHQSLRYGLPEHYEQLQVSLPDHIDRGTLVPSDLHSYGVTIKSGGLAATVPVTG